MGKHSHLKVVRGPDEQSEKAARDASAILGQAVMHAAMAWVRCCLEQDAESVEVSRDSPGRFLAEVKLASGSSQFLHVRLDLSAGPVLRSEVSLVYPD